MLTSAYADPTTGEKKMRALNSWAGNHATLTVTKNDTAVPGAFKFETVAVTIRVKLQVQEGGNYTEPPVDDAYRASTAALGAGLLTSTLALPNLPALPRTLSAWNDAQAGAQ